MKPKINEINYSFSQNQYLEGESEGEEREQIFEFNHSDDFDVNNYPREYRCFITELYKKEYGMNDDD